MPLTDYAVLCLTSLFVIVDPISVVPLFLTMTERNTVSERVRMVTIASGVTAGTLLVFAWGGRFILAAVGVSRPAFQMAGGIILLLVAVDMLRARRPAVNETPEEFSEGVTKDDIAITPLAVPILAGPGAVTAVIMLSDHAESAAHYLLLSHSIVAVAVATWLILWSAAHGARYLQGTPLRMATRLMGLLLAAIAVQFMFTALTAVGVMQA